MNEYEAQQRVASCLESGEHILWTGVPGQGLRLARSDAFVIPFSIFWTGFAIFWEVGVYSTGARPMILFGLPFVLIGIYLMIGRFFVDALIRSGTAYAVTDRRILFVSSWPTRTTRSLMIKSLSEVALDERSDGTGTLRFGPKGEGRTEQPAFKFITSPRVVYDQVRRAQVST
jgi:hypothetical protein